MQEIKSKKCAQCKANFNCVMDKNPSLCCICSTSKEIMRQYMEDAKSFQLKVGQNILSPKYYVDYNISVLKVGTIVAYRYLTAIRIGKVNTIFLDQQYLWVEPLARSGSRQTGDEDEVKWNSILCLLS